MTEEVLSKLKLETDDTLPLRDVVFHTLRDAILEGMLPPGTRLKELQLSSQLGVSRTPVREAIRLLGEEGLVHTSVRRGTALAEGIGEVLTPLPALPGCSILLAKPDIHVSTKAVFDALKLSEQTAHPDTDGQVQAVKARDLKGAARLCGNVLESVTEVKYPVIAAIKQTMKDHGALAAVMSGSGPTVFGIFEEKSMAEEALGALQESGDASFACITRPYNRREEEQA